MDWIDLAQDGDLWGALVNIIMDLRTPQNAGTFLSSCTTGGFLRAYLHEVGYQHLSIHLHYVFKC
jgi:hypothetical protein